MSLNQTEFGALGGVRKGAQVNYEAGERVPDADYLTKIAQAGADVGYILTGMRTPKPAAVGEEDAEYRVVSPREARILDLLEELGEEGLSQVRAIAEKEKRLKELEALVAQGGKRLERGNS